MYSYLFSYLSKSVFSTNHYLIGSLYIIFSITAGTLGLLLTGFIFILAPTRSAILHEGALILLFIKNEFIALLACYGINNIIMFCSLAVLLVVLIHAFYYYTLPFIVYIFYQKFTIKDVLAYLREEIEDNTVLLLFFIFPFFGVLVLFLFIFLFFNLFIPYDDVIFSMENAPLLIGDLVEDSKIIALRHRLTNSYGTIIPIEPLIGSAKRTDIKNNGSLYFFVYNWRSLGQHFEEHKDVIRHNLTTDLIYDALFYVHERADLYNFSKETREKILSKCIYLAQQPTLGGYNLKPVAPEMIQNFIRVSGLNIDLDNIESYGLDGLCRKTESNKWILSICEEIYNQHISLIEKHNFTNPNYDRKIYVDKDNSILNKHSNFYEKYNNFKNSPYFYHITIGTLVISTVAIGVVVYKYSY
jgi:hypothetical protein